MSIQKVHAYFRDYYVKEAENAAQQRRGQADDDDAEEEEDEDAIEEEEDAMDGFLEPEVERAVDCGAPNPKPIHVPSRERTMMRKQKGKEDKAIQVKGRFLFDGPWWNASFESLKQGDTYVCHSSPTYTLRNLQTEKNENGKRLLQLLLRHAFDPATLEPGSANDQIRQAFWDFFEKHRSIRKPKNYTFNQFFKALEAAVKEKPASNAKSHPIEQAAKVIMRQFDPFYGRSAEPSRQDEDNERRKKRKSDLRFLYRCHKFPLLFKVLPLLFEREALSILSTADMKNLEKLDSVLRNSPEDLGFYTSMRKHNWGTIEASFQGFVNAGMIPSNLFRSIAKQRGSTPRPLTSKSKPQKPQPSTSNQPSTSTAKSGKVASKASKSNDIKVISAPMATVLKLYDIVKQGCNRGKHTYLFEEGQVKKEWRKVAIKDYPCGSARQLAYQELEGRRVVKKEKEIDEPVKVHWMKYRRYEKSIASSVGKLFGQHEEDPWILPPLDFTRYNFDDHQQEAANAICRQPLTVILGRGGCGKTHVVSSVIKEYLVHLEEEKQAKLIEERYLAHLEEEKLAKRIEERFFQEVENRKENPEGMCSKDTEDEKKDEKDDEKKNENKDEEEDNPFILLTAPTGRAASILKRRIQMKAKTLHSVLGSIRKCDPENFPYSKVAILVVDECSMMPISVLSEVLTTLLRYSLKKVIFLGDPYQLPSIDPGNFFQDTIKVFNATHVESIQTLRINHRTDEGGRLIDENAGRIAEGRKDQRIELVYQTDRFERIGTSNVVNGAGRREVIARQLRSRWQLKNHKNSQVVSFRNSDVNDINKLACQQYASHFPFKKGGKYNFHIGDKICTRKNSNIFRERITPPGKKMTGAGGSREDNRMMVGDEEAGPSNKNGVEGVRISNGDTFFIENWRRVDSDGKKTDFVTLQSMDDEEGDLYEVDFNDMRRTSKVQYAWARTINTYQGSETDYIVYVVSPHSNYETWQHLYTAITRARKGCFIICTPDRLRQVVQTEPAPRNTSLARFLEENFGLRQDSKPNHPGQSGSVTPSSSINPVLSHPRQSGNGTPSKSINPGPVHPGQSRSWTPSSSINPGPVHPGQSGSGTPSKSINPGPVHPGQSRSETPSSSINPMLSYPRQSGNGTPSKSINPGPVHPGQSRSWTPSSSINPGPVHPGQSGSGTPSKSINPGPVHPGQSRSWTPSSSINPGPVHPGQSGSGTPSKSINPGPVHPGQSRSWTPSSSINPGPVHPGQSGSGTPSSSINPMLSYPRQSGYGTPSKSINPGPVHPGQSGSVTPSSSINQRQFHPGHSGSGTLRSSTHPRTCPPRQSALGTSDSSANSMTHHTEQLATRIPDRTALTNVSSSKKAIACSPCKWDSRQEQLAREALVHQPSASNQATELYNLQQHTPSVRRGLDYEATLGKSSAVDSPGCEASVGDCPAANPNKGRLSRKRKAPSNKVPVQEDQSADALLKKMAHSPKAPKQHSSENALVQITTPVTSAGCESMSVDAPAANPNRSCLSRRKRKAKSDNDPINHCQNADTLQQETAQSPKIPRQHSSESALVQITTPVTSAGCESLSVDAPAANPNRLCLSRRKRKAKSDNVSINHCQNADTLLQETAQSPKVHKLPSTRDALVPRQNALGNMTVQSAPAPEEKWPQTNQENETLIFVPGLRARRYNNQQRLTSESSQSSCQSSQSNEDKENCPFQDSCNTEPSQFLLQPPSISLVLSLLKSSEESHRDGDDAGVSSSDESGFSSSGASPCVGTDENPSEVKDDDNDDGGNVADDEDTDYGEVFKDDDDDDEDGEMSQSIFQLYNVI